MICTVTFNPSLDYIVSVDDFKLGLTNRTSSELMLPGGKGINVSTVLMNLGIGNTALGFTAGFTGDEIIRRLKEIKEERRAGLDRALQIVGVTRIIRAALETMGGKGEEGRV